ncbi:MAG: MarR family transcriptional regulator [Thermoanaerobaculia bacterium]
MKRISAIQGEIKQKKPFSSRAQEAGLGLLRTADVLSRRTADLLLPHGLTPQQYNVLRILRGAGDTGLPTLEIAERMIQRAPGITRLLDRLEAKALVTRKRCPEDRRQVLCFIAPSGLALLGELEVPVNDDDGMLDVLSPADLHKLIGYLDRIRIAASAPLLPTSNTQSPATGQRKGVKS